MTGRHHRKRYYLLIIAAFAAWLAYPSREEDSQIVNTQMPQEWAVLCEKSDCEKFPVGYMTYEVDNAYYYFPAVALQLLRDGPGGWSGQPISFHGSLPQYYTNVRYRWFEPNFIIYEDVYVGWRDLGFEAYLETTPDDLVTRGYGIIRPETPTVTFGVGYMKYLPRFFGIAPDFPDNNTLEFNFQLHSKDSSLGKFRLDYHLQDVDHYLVKPEQIPPEDAIHAFSEVNTEEYKSFYDAFWLIEDKRHVDAGGAYSFEGVRVLSKAPMIHGRFIYGECDGVCYFYTLNFDDEPENPHPLLTIGLGGEVFRAFSSEYCETGDPRFNCDPAVARIDQMKEYFSLIEDLIEKLKEKPS